MNSILIFIFGTMVGAIFGFFTFALLTISKKSQEKE